MDTGQEWSSRGCTDLKFAKSKQYTSLMWTYTARYINDYVFFCVNKPYTYSKLLSFINSLRIQPTAKYLFYKSVLCNSPGGLQVPLLTIESKKFRNIRLKRFHKLKRKDDKDHKQKVVMIIGRQTASDVGSSLMIESLVRFLISDDERAHMLRSRFIFKVRLKIIEYRYYLWLVLME